MGETCRHGMNPAWCSYCKKESQPPEAKRKLVRQPAEKQEVTAFGSATVSSEDMNLVGWTVVHTIKGKENPEYSQLTNVTHVHIQGPTYLWAFEKILANAPKLRQIQVIPCFYDRLRPDSHLRLCTERGVEVVRGHIRPDMAWEGERNISRFYQGQQRFFFNLQGEQKALWEELLAMGFTSAQMAARYFCLNGEDFLSQRVIGQQFGYNIHDAIIVASRKINGVIAYLDPTFEASPDAQFTSRGLKRKVQILRGYFQAADREKQLADEVGVPSIPQGLPIARYQIYKELAAAQQSGQLGRLQSTKPDCVRALDLRFGLTSGTYLTLERVGQLMDGITRERVRQLEEECLNLLGISHED